MEQRKFAVGETIFSEGEASGEAFLIRSGRVSVLKDSPNGRICLAILGPGDVLGEMGLLDDRPRSATAEASEAVTADAVDREEFLRLVLERPEESLGLLRGLFERLRHVNQMLADVNQPMQGANRVPKMTLYPLSPETEAVVATAGLPVTRFPFRLGRRPASREDRAFGFNDVEVEDQEPHKVSLNHCSLDLGISGGVVVRDRGSRLGTIVNGTRIGAREAHDLAPLKAGENELVLGAVALVFGSPQSPYRFKVVVEAA